jgi:hypothetical protein
MFTEPVTVKRGVVGRILHRVPYPFIDEGIEIATLHGLDIRRKAVSDRHTRELPEELFIDYCVPIKICASSKKRRQE